MGERERERESERQTDRQTEREGPRSRSARENYCNAFRSDIGLIEANLCSLDQPRFFYSIKFPMSNTIFED